MHSGIIDLSKKSCVLCDRTFPSYFDLFKHITLPRWIRYDKSNEKLWINHRTLQNILWSFSWQLTVGGGAIIFGTQVVSGKITPEKCHFRRMGCVGPRIVRIMLNRLFYCRVL